MPQLRLFEVNERDRLELGVVNGEPTVVGREPDYGIKLTSEAVSGEHGIFIPFRGHWLYRDLDSTNGSWLNGVKLSPQVAHLLRQGDVIQLADKALAVEIDTVSETGTLFPRSLLVFTRGEAHDEYPVPEFGRALVIGGTKADLKLDVDVHEVPSLVFEARGDSLVAFPVAKETLPFYNGEPLTRSYTLKDRDELVVENYRVIVSFVEQPVNSSKPAITIRGFADDDDITAGKAQRSMKFGKTGDVPQADRASQIERKPGRRQFTVDNRIPALQHVEEKIVAFVGIGLLLALIALFLIWVLS
jgi:hypothetical protein